MSKELKAWFTVDELNAWADKKLKENPQWAEQPPRQDIPDLIAGALGVSRGTAYDMMREALAEAQPEERNFCPRCGKRTADLTVIHTCTPPQENTCQHA